MNEQLLHLTDHDLKELRGALRASGEAPGLRRAVEAELEYRADMRMIRVPGTPWWIEALGSILLVAVIAAVAWWWL